MNCRKRPSGQHLCPCKRPALPLANEMGKGTWQWAEPGTPKPPPGARFQDSSLEFCHPHPAWTVGRSEADDTRLPIARKGVDDRRLSPAIRDMKIPASETRSCCRRGHGNCVSQGLVSAPGSRLGGAGQANMSLQISQACDRLGRMGEGDKARIRKSSDIAGWVSQPCSRTIVRDPYWLSCAALTR